MNTRINESPAASQREMDEPFSLSWSARSELLLACAALLWAGLCIGGWVASTLRFALMRRDLRVEPDRDL
jgi:hypothetical protein